MIKVAKYILKIVNQITFSALRDIHKLSQIRRKKHHEYEKHPDNMKSETCISKDKKLIKV